MKLHIKYMVSDRCRIAVKKELKKLGLHFIMVDLGEVELMENITTEQRIQLNKRLHCTGLELMDDTNEILIEKIKSSIIDLIHDAENEPHKINFHNFLTEKLKHNYTYLAHIFSEVAGTSIEHFIVAHRIERAKELILYDELSLTETAYRLNYSSVAHLSYQFKKFTGLTPTHYKQLKDKKRTPIEDIGN
jgi:AraC-like DNA-binding protein